MQLNQRVDINLLNLLALRHNLRHGRDVLRELGPIQRGLSSESSPHSPLSSLPIQHLLRLQIVQRHLRLLHAHRTHVEHHVLQHLHHHAAQSRHGDRTERRVAIGADHHLRAERHHLVQHHAVVVDALLAELRVQLVHHRAGLFGRRQTQLHAAHIALMDDLRDLSFASVFALLKKSAASLPAVTSL